MTARHDWERKQTAFQLGVRHDWERKQTAFHSVLMTARSASVSAVATAGDYLRARPRVKKEPAYRLALLICLLKGCEPLTSFFLRYYTFTLLSYKNALQAILWPFKPKIKERYRC